MELTNNISRKFITYCRFDHSSRSLLFEKTYNILFCRYKTIYVNVDKHIFYFNKKFDMDLSCRKYLIKKLKKKYLSENEINEPKLIDGEYVVTIPMSFHYETFRHYNGNEKPQVVKYNMKIPCNSDIFINIHKDLISMIVFNQQSLSMSYYYDDNRFTWPPWIADSIKSFNKKLLTMYKIEFNMKIKNQYYKYPGIFLNIIDYDNLVIENLFEKYPGIF